MTSISNNLTSYLSGLFNDQTNSKSTSTPSLADALAGITGSTQTDSTAKSSSSGASYLLSLSEEARNYLANHQTTQTQQSNSSGSFLLSNQQRSTIADILQKYKDAPFTQDTFNNILADLKSAGLAPDQLAAKEQVRNLNPTATLLAALNGDSSSTSLPGQADTSDYQAKGENYLDAIYASWQKLSTTYDATTDHSPYD